MSFLHPKGAFFVAVLARMLLFVLSNVLNKLKVRGGVGLFSFVQSPLARSYRTEQQ